MKLTIRNLGFACLIMSIAALAVLEGCGSPPPHERQTGQLLDDKVTAGRVQAALTNNPAYNFPHVLVAAADGTVFLSGYVENEVQRQQATALAQSVNQVNKVENDIQLHPASIPINKPFITGTAHAF